MQLCNSSLHKHDWITAYSDAPQQIMALSSNQRRTGTFGFNGGKIFNSPEFLRHSEENE